jgi:farnesyl-diphosphate farnesyltransferase
VNQTSSNNHGLNHYPPSQDTSTKREGQASCSEIHGDNAEFQATLLAGVSRTFALTIPQLPPELRHVVSNAYLLCRTVDTIEDEPGLSPVQKKSFCDQFLEILQTDKDPEGLVAQLGPLLTAHTIAAEHELIRQLKRVVGITKSFAPEQQTTLVRCVQIMSEGMVYFQYRASPGGLQHQDEMDKYCYHVAGVVGEMLSDLFCYY